MRQLQTMAVLAVGMTFGLACGDAVHTLLPPDAGAQADGGGVTERPAPRVLEFECPISEPLDPANDARVIIGEDVLSVDEMMLARAWKCGLETSDGSNNQPEASCAEADVVIHGAALTVVCGIAVQPPVGDAAWSRALSVRVLVP